MSGKPADYRLSARELILTLMDSATSGSLSSRYFVAAGRLFDMDSGSIRVALARLVRDGSLATETRGHYRLGTRAGALHTLVRNWSRSEDSLKPWTGSWLTLLVGHLARTNKTRVRSNERALGLFGFAEAGSGTWIRPDNLTASMTDVREALLALGLDSHSVAARIAEFDPPDFLEPADLWSTRALEARYRAHLKTLADSTERLATLNDADGARDTLLVGRKVTRDILLDPLLPDELVDGELRRQMVAAMRRYDRIGKTYWREFFERHEGSATEKSTVRAPRGNQNPAA